MIFDKLSGAETYMSVSKNLSRAFRYLMDTDFSKVEPGKYEIEGTSVFALVQSYDSKPEADCRWEAHNSYIDIQYIVNGSERMGFGPRETMTSDGEFDKTRDIGFLKGAGNFVTVNSGYFAVFMPQDAHMPCIAIDKPQAMKKVVMKVAVE